MPGMMKMMAMMGKKPKGKKKAMKKKPMMKKGY